MAKGMNNPLIQSLSGKPGDVVYRRMCDGTPALKKREFSEKQLAQHRRLKQAAEYAREAAGSVPRYAELAKQKRQSAYTIASSDWLQAPVVHRVERRLERIDIYASDNVQVTKIYVTIRNEQGITLEQGQAAPVCGEHWAYQTEVPGSVLVEAFDLAGNVTRYEAGLNP
jgi:hypothetical protein